MTPLMRITPSLVCPLLRIRTQDRARFAPSLSLRRCPVFCSAFCRWVSDFPDGFGTETEYCECPTVARQSLPRPCPGQSSQSQPVAVNKQPNLHHQPSRFVASLRKL